jgi:shikimate dehydrogenase
MAESKHWSFGLVGYPLGHSISPVLHRAALQACGLSGVYNLFPIEPGPLFEVQFSEICQKIRKGDLDGINVTIPHKQAVIHFLDQLSLTARGVGAVNTIYLRDQSLMGDNTDVDGFLIDLNCQMANYGIQPDSDASYSHRCALVLGAGGSARAISCGLLRQNWQVTLASRRVEQARKLSEELSGNLNQDLTGRLDILEFHGSGMADWVIARKSNFVLLVNTTPVGMWPKADESPWPGGSTLPRFSFIYDLVYNPAETLLVRQAHTQGIKAVTGLGMLIEQARLAFERWTGYDVSSQVFWTAVRSMKGSNEHD